MAARTPAPSASALKRRARGKHSPPDTGRAPPPSPGMVLGSRPGWTLGERLTEAATGGGGAAVFATTTETGLPRSIKVVNNAPTAEDLKRRYCEESHARALLNQERQAYVRLQSGAPSDPGIPKVLVRQYEWWGTDDNYAWLVLPRFGPSLDAVLKAHRATASGGLDAPSVALLATQMLGVMERIHRHGRIHRDVNASSIRFGDGSAPDSDAGQAYLLDYAHCEAALDHDHDGDAASDYVAGSRLYVSPFVAAGSDFGRRDDLISLALVLFECIDGTLPWAFSPPEGMDASREAGIAALCKDPRPYGKLLSAAMGLSVTDVPPYARLRKLFVSDVATTGFAWIDEATTAVVAAAAAASVATTKAATNEGGAAGGTSSARRRSERTSYATPRKGGGVSQARGDTPEGRPAAEAAGKSVATGSAPAGGGNSANGTSMPASTTSNGDTAARTASSLATSGWMAPVSIVVALAGVAAAAWLYAT